MHDVVVIGGGPAGLVAAEALARLGHDVAVLEEHATIGQPVHCTGVVSLDVFSELGLPTESLLGVCQTAKFVAPTGRSVTVSSDRLVAGIVDRAVFDAVLADRAASAGATIVTGTRVSAISTDGRQVRAYTSPVGAAVEARACVLACGANYRLQMQLGLGTPRAYLRSAQTEVRFPERDHLEIRFGRETAPGGFAWIVPFKRGQASWARIGLMCEDDARRRFRRLSEAVRRDAGVDLAICPPARPRVLPLSPLAKTYALRVLAVGDAAGLVKPTTGGGVYYSMLTGRLAAEILDPCLRRNTLKETDLRAYEAGWQAQMGREIRAGRAFRAIAERLGDSAIDDIVELARTDGIVPLLKQAGNFNWHASAALALLRNQSFRRIVIGSLAATGFATWLFSPEPRVQERTVLS